MNPSFNSPPLVSPLIIIKFPSELFSRIAEALPILTLRQKGKFPLLVELVKRS